MSSIRETDLYDVLTEQLNTRLPSGVICRSGEDIEYNLRYTTDDDTRSHSFSTDLTVSQDDHPRVIVEVKRNNATTHDLLAYDAKARRHKRVYPSLRYGMFLVEASGLTKKYLWHANNIDFFYSTNREMDDAEDFASDELDEFAELVRQNIQASQRIDQVLNDQEKPSMLHRKMSFG